MKRKYVKGCKGLHQWDKQPFGRKKCLRCGKIQRQNNTTSNRIARRKKLGVKLSVRQKSYLGVQN